MSETLLHLEPLLSFPFVDYDHKGNLLLLAMAKEEGG